MLAFCKILCLYTHRIACDCEEIYLLKNIFQLELSSRADILFLHLHQYLTSVDEFFPFSCFCNGIFHYLLSVARTQNEVIASLEYFSCRFSFVLFNSHGKWLPGVIATAYSFTVKCKGYIVIFFWLLTYFFVCLPACTVLAPSHLPAFRTLHGPTLCTWDSISNLGFQPTWESLLNVEPFDPSIEFGQ